MGKRIYLIKMKKAILMDRDGVINVYVKDIVGPEQFVLLAGVPEAIRRINQEGYLAIVVTNQPILAKGFCTFEDIERIHERMYNELASYEAHIDGVYICPHHPEMGFPGEVAELKINCDCRKPKPGLLLRAIRENSLDVTCSWMIGDSYSDVESGQRAGLKTILLTGGDLNLVNTSNFKPDYINKDLLDAVSFIFDNSRGG